MFNKLNNMGRGFTFISLLTGITAVIIAFFILVLMECNAYISLNGIFDKISRISFFELLFYVFCFCIGFFIHGIRYWGFDYYRRLYEKNKQKQKHERPLPMRIMFYIFRKGTIVEECFNEKRHPDATYNWIRTSNKPEADVWNHAKKISLEFPQVDVYKFYYHSEAFQCFDTVFFLSFFIAFCIGMFGIFVFGVNCERIGKKYLCMLFFSLALLLLHLICKGTSRAFARRFFLEIQTDLNVLNEKEEKEKRKKVRIDICKINPLIYSI